MSIETRLQQIFEFTQDDLTANRKGRITDVQKQRLAEVSAGNRRFAWAILLFLTIIGMVGASLSAITTADFTVIQAAAMILVVMGLTAIVIWFVMTWHRYRMERAIETGVVASSEGVVYLWSQGHKPTEYYLQVGNQRFTVYRTLYVPLYSLKDQFTGREAVIYYTPLTRHILSIDMRST